MGMIMDVKRSGFYQELSPEMQKEYLGIIRNKFLPTIDTLYFSIYIKGDGKIENDGRLDADAASFEKIENLMESVKEAKDKANATHEPVLFSHGLTVNLISFGRYSYCLTETDLFDVFLIYTLPNVETPRIVVQIRSFGLWTRKEETMLLEAYGRVESLLSSHGLEIERTRENRIDYCYHTNIISSPNKIFREKSKGERTIVKNVFSNLKKRTLNEDIISQTKEGIEVEKNYIRLGSQKSKNVIARVYDKAKEVIEQGYKAYFFELWYENGLISYYDRWCFEYAYLHKSMDKLNQARLEFYIEHGSNEARRKQYDDMLNNPKTTNDEIKRAADEFMPKNTPVLNIEYQTMRKYYVDSQSFIKTFFKLENEHEFTIPEPLKYVFRIIDNRDYFLEALTRETLSFQKEYRDENGERYLDYLPWWKKLRDVKINGRKLRRAKLREYSHEMDVRAVQKKGIDSVGTSAVYNDNPDSDFAEDYSDFLAEVTDNRKHELEIRVNGKKINKMDGALLRRYAVNKLKKEARLKNRKMKREEKWLAENAENFTATGEYDLPFS